MASLLSATRQPLVSTTAKERIGAQADVPGRQGFPASHWSPCMQVTTAMQHMEQHPGKELPVVVVTITKETMMALRTDMCAAT